MRKIIFLLALILSIQGNAQKKQGQAFKDSLLVELPLKNKVTILQKDSWKKENSNNTDATQKGNLVSPPIYFKNNSNQDCTMLLDLNPVPASIKVFIKKNSHFVLWKNSGGKIPNYLRDIGNNPKNIWINVPKKTKAICYFELQPYQGKIAAISITANSQNKGLQQEIALIKKSETDEILQFLFAGFFFAISMFGILKAFTNQKDQAYFWYASVNFFYGLGLISYYNIPDIENHYMPWFQNSFHLAAIANCCTAASYTLFYRNILELKKNSKYLYIFTKIYIPINLTYLFLLLVSTVVNNPLMGTLLRISDVFYELLSLVQIIYITIYLLKRRNGYLKYIFYGCCSLIIGLLIFVPFSLLNNQNSSKAIDVGVIQNLILTLSLMVEVYFFLTALVFRDKLIEQEKNIYFQELAVQKESNQIKTRFFSILNHDLRGPVANLIHFLHLQKNNPELLDEETKNRMQNKTISGAENLLSSMEDILLWSKGQMENFKPQATNIEVNHLFEDTKKVFSGYHNITFNYENPENLEIFTDENYLKTIVRNLTSNAINVFTSTKNPTITWKAWQENSVNYLSISDNGPGASQEQFKALYDDKEVVGIKTGLGLHLIRDLAKAINCEITVDSKENEGTTFVLKF